MPSADFFHAVKAGCPALSQFSSHETFHGTWKTSRGKHMSFNTWAPSIRTELIMDRGLCLVLQARPTHARLTRFLFVTPYFRGTLPQQGYCLPKYRHRYPVVIPLHPSPPSGWVWDLKSLKIKGKLNAPLRMRAVPGTHRDRDAHH